LGERIKAGVGLGPDEVKALKHMEIARQLMADGDNIKAAKEFQWAAYYWQGTTVEEDARYLAAECFYREKRYSDAVEQYTKLLTNFQSSKYKIDSIKNVYGIAKTWIKQVTEDRVNYVNLSDKSRPTFDTFGHAERALKTIYTNCPTDPVAADSVFLLGHGYMRLGRTQGDAAFENAADYFKQLRDCYPNSEHIVEAMRLEVICREKAGLGADYDPRHLNEARKIAEQLSQQYRTRLPADQQNELLQIQNNINEQLAEKLWVQGQFWDGRKDYNAARMQYMEIINKYPTTKYADMSQTRYEQICDLPDELPSDWQRIKSKLTFGRK
jgi:tetratricopeptide (TPR) repeat protein